MAEPTHLKKIYNRQIGSKIPRYRGQNSKKNISVATTQKEIDSSMTCMFCLAFVRVLWVHLLRQSLFLNKHQQITWLMAEIFTWRKGLPNNSPQVGVIIKDCWWFRTPKQPPGMYKALFYVIFYHINWLAGFLNHQQYVWKKHLRSSYPNSLWKRNCQGTSLCVLPPSPFKSPRKKNMGIFPCQRHLESHHTKEHDMSILLILFSSVHIETNIHIYHVYIYI